jgi:catecholate siderophore receptor
MSKYVRSSKKSVISALPSSPLPEKLPIEAIARSPLSPAAVGLASVMFVTGAAAQDATPAAKPTTTAQAQESTVLPEIQVRSRRRAAVRRAPAAPAPAPAEPPPPANRTGDVGYQATQQSITRLPTPLRDTPQTVNVVTQQVLQTQRITTMEDALRTVPGITFQAGEGGQQGDSPIIRGFAARGDMFRDGIRDPGFYNRDLFSADRVEVYKGPSAFAFGRGSTGGAINIVSKLPTGASFIDTVITGTTAAGYRVEMDASGKKANWSGRIAAMYQDMPTPNRNHVKVERWGVAPSLEYDFKQGTKALVSYIYQGEDSVPDYGWPYLPAPTRNITTGVSTGGYFGNGLPTPPVPINRENWFGVANGPLADVLRTETHVITGRIEHEFNKDLKIVNATRYITNDRFLRTTAPRSLGGANNVAFPNPLPAAFFNFPVDQMTIGRQHFQVETDNTLLVNQTDLTGKFNTGPFEHTFATGGEVAKETRFQQRARGLDANNLCAPTNALCRTSLAFPQDTSFGGVFAGYNNPNMTETRNWAVYAFDQVKLNQYFELLGSIRFDRFTADFTDLNTAPVTNLSRTDEMLSWRVGGVFHPIPTASLYAAYGVSFNPAAEFQTLSSSATNGANAQLPPEQNTTLELGYKQDVLNGKLSLSGAVFRIEKTNLRIPIDPVLNTALVLDGLARVDGVEVGVAGKVTEPWQVFLGYSFLRSEIVSTSDPRERGNHLPNTPQHNFTVWTTYDVTPRWTVGGGAVYASDSFVNTQNTSFVPEYWKVDLMTSYKVTKNSLLQLNIYNVTDELYFAQYYSGHAVPASGRWASLTYRVRFDPDPSKMGFY